MLRKYLHILQTKVLIKALGVNGDKPCLEYFFCNYILVSIGTVLSESQKTINSVFFSEREYVS
uniref:Uncharacterized protein n=1 Tax=uncultured marine virus TaxID=186617 RepID=A0A0F7L616_9VIRU|nr:hypothetical protein [uncultured marine virus]